MPVIRVQGVVGSGESYFQELRTLSRSGLPIDLQLPRKLKGDAFGGEPAILQLIASWSERRNGGSAIVDIAPDISAQEFDAVLRGAEHLRFAALIGAPVRTGDTDITILARLSAQRVLHTLANDDRQRRANQVSFMVADEFDWIAPRALYPTGSVSNGIEMPVPNFPTMADSILDLRQSQVRRQLNPIRRSVLAWCLFELFANTHQWGRDRRMSDSSLDERAKSLRLLSARYHRIPSDQFEKRIGDNEHFRHYAESLLEGVYDRDRTALRLFEVSVLDTGLGIADRRATEQYGQREFRLAERVTALRWALARQRTESFDALKGIGFHRAFSALTSMSGFIQIRTGDLFAVRDFIADPYPTAREVFSADHDDRQNGWTEFKDGLAIGGDEFIVPAAASTGTRITMLFPLTEEWFVS